ncbi:MAG TPA: arylsulfatase [Bryobacteraceae bacterium]|nr:arylsulfatase [Bryobacteraceae bacterium]
MNRRQFLASSGAALLGAQAPARQPNIVFILADDLGYGDIGCYGQKRILTPNLDRMAAEGTRFTQAYAGSTVCAPSRCALMTGKHTGHTTVRGNRKPEVGLKEAEATVATLLQKAGYRTALFGKWGLGGPGTGSVPNTRGFDEFYGYLDQQHAHNSYPGHLWDNQNEVFLTENWFHQRKAFSNDLFTARAVKYIERQNESPFFLYLPYTIPHANNELAKYQENGMEAPDDGPYGGEPWKPAEKTFASAITRMDRDVGSILAALERKRLADNTLVIFTSDNGPHREGNHDPEFFGSRGPLRGIKRDLYEGGIRVPAIARWPGRVPAGRTSDAVWAFWDFLPTAAELAGAARPAGIDGASFASALAGKASANSRTLYWEFHERGFHQAVRRGNWKLVRQGPAQALELFDLSADIGETRNLAADKPAMVRELEALFGQSRTDSPHFPVKRS